MRVLRCEKNRSKNKTERRQILLSKPRRRIAPNERKEGDLDTGCKDSLSAEEGGVTNQ